MAMEKDQAEGGESNNSSMQPTGNWLDSTTDDVRALVSTAACFVAFMMLLCHI